MDEMIYALLAELDAAKAEIARLRVVAGTHLARKQAQEVLVEQRKEIGMSDKFKGRYTVTDGYVGGDRPQTFTFCAGDLEDGMTDEDLERAYEEAAQGHFEQHVMPNVDKFDEFKAWAREQLAARIRGA